MAVAGIGTLNGTNLWFDASTNMCDTFDNCEGWGPATRILWRALPLGISVHYFKGEDCNNGDLVFFTDPAEPSGSKVLPKKSGGHQIRSLMAVGTNKLPTRGIVAECFYDLAAFAEHANVSRSINIAANSTDSSTWMEPLPDVAGSTA